MVVIAREETPPEDATTDEDATPGLQPSTQPLSPLPPASPAAEADPDPDDTVANESRDEQPPGGKGSKKGKTTRLQARLLQSDLLPLEEHTEDVPAPQAKKPRLAERLAAESEEPEAMKVQPTAKVRKFE